MKRTFIFFKRCKGRVLTLQSDSWGHEPRRGIIKQNCICESYFTQIMIAYSFLNNKKNQQLTKIAESLGTSKTFSNLQS